VGFVWPDLSFQGSETFGWKKIKRTRRTKAIYRVSCAVEVSTAKLQNLLWCAVAAGFGSPLRLNPHCRVYLLNPNKGIVVHPYDDRGMDIISRRTSASAGLYQRHNDPLLDYDMEAMR